jgi:hypothetical protein
MSIPEEDDRIGRERRTYMPFGGHLRRARRYRAPRWLILSPAPDVATSARYALRGRFSKIAEMGTASYFPTNNAQALLGHASETAWPKAAKSELPARRWEHARHRFRDIKRGSRCS